MAQVHFADAWYFIALLDPRDRHSQHARRLRQYITETLVTHDAVLTEVLAYFSDEGPWGRQLATDAVRNALKELVVISIDRTLFLRALDFYERRPDKEYSLVDCMSMVIMRERGITHVLTSDHHFRQEGFTVLSDAP